MRAASLDWLKTEVAALPEDVPSRGSIQQVGWEGLLLGGGQDDGVSLMPLSERLGGHVQRPIGPRCNAASAGAPQIGGPTDIAVRMTDVPAAIQLDQADQHAAREAAVPPANGQL